MDQPDLDNPYPGLRPFLADETHLFFGRDAHRIELLQRLRQTRFLAVVGTSGSGKSSLVRAGLLPGLLGGFMAGQGRRWRIADLRPGTDPIGNLARALDQVGALREQPLAEDESSFTAATLRRSSLGLVQAFDEARLPASDTLLVLVDQFEELFRGMDSGGTVSHDDAAAFVKLLLAASTQAQDRIYVVLTMRSDFLGDCARFRGLPEAINAGQYLVPRLTRDQTREAIAGPAAVRGVMLASSLLDRLLNDVADSPDQLPILQHALMRTWDHWVRRRAAGDVEHAARDVGRRRRGRAQVRLHRVVDEAEVTRLGAVAEDGQALAVDARGDEPRDHRRVL
jgi:energy-coupling factor transporter ATP-binding protein EcfA2